MSQQIPEWVRGYIGIPFAWNGRDRDGMDCYGLVAEIYSSEWGIELPDYINKYTGEQDNADQLRKAFLSGISESCWNPCTNPQVGDVVIISLAQLPLHCGLMVSEYHMLHVDRPELSSRVSDLRRPQWSDRIVAYYRYVDHAHG